jgi:hypothetical protein
VTVPEPRPSAWWARAEPAWLIPALVGLAIAVSLPFYRQAAAVRSFFFVQVGSGAGSLLGNRTDLARYWLVAGLTVFAVSAWILRPRIWAAAGLIVLALASWWVLDPAAASAFRAQPQANLVPGDLTVRGLGPVLVAALAIAALAVVRHQTGLLVAAIVLIGIALVVNLYDVVNLYGRLVGTLLGTAIYSQSALTNAATAAAAFLVTGTIGLCRSARGPQPSET